MEQKLKKLITKDITKWLKVCLHLGTDEGAKNSSLCQEFHKGANCDGCPVKQKTGRNFCLGTEYEKWINYQQISGKSGPFKTFNLTSVKLAIDIIKALRALKSSGR